MITGSRCAWSDGVTAQHNRLPDWCNLYIFCHYRQKFSRIHFSPFLNSQFVYFRSFFITWLIIWHKIRWQQAFPARDRTDLPVYLFWNVHVCFQWGWWWYYKFGLKSNFVIYLDNETISTEQRSIILSSPRRLPSPSTLKFLPQMHSGGEKNNGVKNSPRSHWLLHTSCWSKGRVTLRDHLTDTTLTDEQHLQYRLG